MTKQEVQEQAKALGLSGELRHLDSLKANPDNPRVMRDEKFTKLCNSIREFPKMMALRPMVFDESGTVLGGNMRLRALQELGYRFIPVEWAKAADALTDDEKRRFIIEDNVGFGDWDWDALANEWTDEPLVAWGLDVWEEPEEAAKELEHTPKNERPEVEFTEVLGEKHNYVVLYFDNEVDWLQAQTLLQMKPVAEWPTRKDGEVERFGVGRVLKGSDALERLREGLKNAD